MKWLMATALIVATAGGAGAQEARKQITQAQVDGYRQYLDWLTPIGHGVFAVSTDGRSWSGWGCPDGRCTPGPSYASKAIENCETQGNRARCYVFARNREIAVDYVVVMQPVAVAP